MVGKRRVRGAGGWLYLQGCEAARVPSTFVQALGSKHMVADATARARSLCSIFARKSTPRSCRKLWGYAGDLCRPWSCCAFCALAHTRRAHASSVRSVWDIGLCLALLFFLLQYWLNSATYANLECSRQDLLFKITRRFIYESDSVGTQQHHGCGSCPKSSAYVQHIIGTGHFVVVLLLGEQLLVPAQ